MHLPSIKRCCQIGQKACGSSRLPDGAEKDQIDVNYGNARGMGAYRLLKEDAKAHLADISRGENGRDPPSAREVEIVVKDAMQASGWRTANRIVNSHTAKVIRLD